MKNRIIAFFLSFIMVMSMFAQYVPGVSAREIDPWEEPEAYVGSVATFNTDELVDFHIFGNPESYDYDLCWEDNTYWIYNSETTDELPDDAMQMVITGYYDHEVPVAEDQTRRFVWYKVEAAEGYELPEKMADKSYVLYMTTEDYELAMPASLVFDLIDKPQEPEVPEEPENAGKPELGEGYTIEEVGLKGYFSEDVVKFYQQPVGTAITADLNTAELPDFIDVAWMVTDTRLSKPEVWYAVKVDENWSDIADWLICYVPISHVTLVPAEVTEFYEKLLGAATVDEYEELMENADSELMEQLTEKHFANLGNHYNDMVEAETRTEEGTVTIGEVSVPVTVTGLLPEGATVSVDVVDDAAIMDGGFDIKSEDEIVLALDIKVLDKDGNEWQPKEGRQITVTIGMAELGYEDGKIFRLHHKHGEEIDVFEVFVVMDGKLTVRTNGFSTYLVSAFGDPEKENNAVEVKNEGTITLTVGEDVIYYANPSVDRNTTLQLGTWQVTDEEGAIFYEVYTTSGAGNGGYYAPWIRIVALKETTTVTLKFVYRGTRKNGYIQTPIQEEETYTLNIVKPQPNLEEDPDGKLYIKDNVNEAGVITAVLTDGEETIPLGDDYQFSWVRSDGAYIIPSAYKENGSSIDICSDHGGLIERRANPGNNRPPEYITYTVTVTLPNGRQKTADYTVYYQSEIINASFESPDAPRQNYTFFMNGWPGLYWKTTSPGTGNNLTKDVEYADYARGGNDSVGGGFYPREPKNGSQFAELNAEEFGALYQDIITAPNETVDWQFYHAKRDPKENGEAMYLIMGPTKQAQKLTTYDELDKLIDYVLAKTTDGENNETILKRGEAVSCTYTDGAEYTLWYHDADVNNTPDTAWDFLEGEYEPKDGQYRTRLFFVTDTNSSNKDSNYGNLIDSSTAGQYKRYLIEYYEEQYVEVNGSNVMKYEHMAKYDEGYTLLENGEKVYDEVLIYSTVFLKNFDYFEEYENDLLASVYINGDNYPYNIRYSNNKPGLFIEKYPSKADQAKHYDEDEPNPNNYAEYDIVMQVFFRDTVVAVQKWVEFPIIPGTNQEALTAIQKQQLIDGLMAKNDGKGYQAIYDLYCETDEEHLENKAISITKNDPSGWYTGYIPIGDNPNKDHDFTLTEKSVPPLPGLELENVIFDYYQFYKGERTLAKTVEYDKNVTIKEVVNGEQVNYELVTKDGKSVSCEGIVLQHNNDKLRVAEIKVTNKYREKEVKINYVAVGKGTVDVQDETINLALQDSESFLYYSGKPKGVVAKPDTNYTFAGWYLDAACTQPVDENHGYVDYLDPNKTIARFTPNKNKTIDDDNLEVTYYAKFSTGSLLIVRENAEPGQVFVYKVEDENDKEMYVTVVADENGKGSVEIVNVPFNIKYRVTQLNEWSWRYGNSDVDLEKLHEMTDGLHGSTNMTTVFKFTETLPKQETIVYTWLNGNSEIKKNLYGGKN